MEGSVNMKMEVCCLPGVSEPMAIFKPFSFQYVYSGAHCENHSPSLLPTKTSWSSSFTDASTGSSKSSCFLFIKAAAPPDSINLQRDLVSRAWFSLAVLTNSLLQTNSVSSCGAEHRIEVLSSRPALCSITWGGSCLFELGCSAYHKAAVGFQVGACFGKRPRSVLLGQSRLFWPQMPCLMWMARCWGKGTDLNLQASDRLISFTNARLE